MTLISNIFLFVLKNKLQYKIKKYLGINIALLLFLSTLFSPAYSENYRIAAGTEGGGYNNFSHAMITELSQNDNSPNFYLIESSGSVENISLLRKGIADFAVLQQNIAAESYFNEVSPYKGFEVLGPLYPEIFQVIVFGKGYEETRPLTFTDITQLIKTRNIEAIYVDGKGTASHLFVNRLLTLHGMSESFIPYVIHSKNTPAKNCQTICIAAFITSFSGIYTKFDITVAHYVHLTINEYLNIATRISGFELFQIEQDNGEKWLALGTWAILVAGHTLDTSIHNKLKSDIDSYIIRTRAERVNRSDAQLSVARIVPSNIIKTTSIVDHIDKAIYNSLPLTNGLEKRLTNGLNLKFVFIYVLSILVAFYLIKKLFVIQYGYVWNRYRHFILSAVFLLVVFILFGKVIHFSEKALALETGIVSTISTYTLTDMYEWIIIFAFTGYSSNVFPASILGQFISTFSHLIGLGTALFSVLAEIIFMKKQKKREAGEFAMKMKQHIVICGANDQIHQLIKNLKKSLTEYQKKTPKIVIIFPEFGQILEKNPALKAMHEYGEIEYIKGAVREESTLEAANISEAQIIYLLAEDKTVSSDEKTLLRALSISMFCRKKNKLSHHDDIDSIYMVAEISNDEFSDSLRNADVNEIVNTTTLSENLLIQSALNPGLSKIVSSLLTIDDGHEFYTINISEQPFLVEKTFDELLSILREKNILLIGIQVNFIDDYEMEIIDSILLSERLAELDLTRQVLTNPYLPAEKKYKANSIDKLVVLAESIGVLTKLSFAKK